MAGEAVDPEQQERQQGGALDEADVHDLTVHEPEVAEGERADEGPGGTARQPPGEQVGARPAQRVGQREAGGPGRDGVEQREQPREGEHRSGVPAVEQRRAAPQEGVPAREVSGADQLAGEHPQRVVLVEVVAEHQDTSRRRQRDGDGERHEHEDRQRHGVCPPARRAGGAVRPAGTPGVLGRGGPLDPRPERVAPPGRACRSGRRRLSAVRRRDSGGRRDAGGRRESGGRRSGLGRARRDGFGARRRGPRRHARLALDDGHGLPR